MSCGLQTRLSGIGPPAFSCVIKPTSSSGRAIIARSEKEYIAAMPKIKSWFNEDYFLSNLEKNYATFEQKVILRSTSTTLFRLRDQFTVRGTEPRLVTLIDRYTKSRQTFDIDGTPLGVGLYYPLQELEPASWEFLPSLLRQSRILPGGTGRFYTADGEKIFPQAVFRPAR